MLEFGQNWPAVDIAEQMFVVLSLGWEPSIINENILGLLTQFGFVCIANRQDSRVVQWSTRVVWQGCNSTGGLSRWR
jgi:hypothetical protein